LIETLGCSAGESIVTKASELNADLIVCGTHGRRGVRRLLMGSDADYIVRRAPVPVLLVRSQEPAAREAA
jgi:nucleotide-binding universal stress UspA family protein